MLVTSAGWGWAPARALATEPPQSFVETFEGAPASPRAWSSPRWDVIVHDRTDGATNAMQADHDHACAPPPTTHAVHSPAEAVYQCRDHLMTALTSSDPGYAVIYLTPSAMVDWTAGPATIAFDVSTARSTNRDWIDVWLTPWEHNMVLPLEDSTPDLNGPPRQGLHFRLVNKFAWLIHRYPGAIKLSSNDWQDLPVPFLRAQRDTFTISIGGGFVTLDYLNVASGRKVRVERMRLPANLGFSRAVVQLGHHSYTPDKDCHFSVIGSCGPNTWHWDNVRISPAQHFRMTKVGRLARQGSIPVAPGLLRFAARGRTEIDWGRGWVAVDPVNGPPDNEGHFASYLVPVPDGVTRASVRGSPTWAGPWRAENISVWSIDEAVASPAASLPPASAAPGAPLHGHGAPRP